MRTSKDIARKFGRRAEIYDEKAQLQKNVAKKLASFLPKSSYENILEIGCGTGFMTEYLANVYPDAQKHITDLSPEMVELCAEKFKDTPNMTFGVLDGQAKKIAKGYDLVVSSMCVQWFDAPNDVLKEWKTHADVCFATLGPDNFKEWRALLAGLDLPFGGRILTDLPGVISDEIKQVPYSSAYDFLKELKQIGAETATPDYNILAPRQLKKLIAAYDDQDQKQISWHIVYGHL